MKLKELIDRSYQTFHHHASTARIILLHPQSHYRSVLVARLINSPDVRTIYYAMGPDDLNLESLISGLTHDLANQHPTFGRHTNMLPPDVYSDPAQLDLLLETFARDLDEVFEDDFYFILDEYDRSDTADDIQQFVERLSRVLPDQCRIIINSRTLPRLPWVSLVAQGLAVLLEDDQLIEDNFYSLTEDSEETLEVYALGPGFVLMNGKPIETWEGHLPRLLFFFALDRPVVTRSEICHAFWPELDTDQAVNVFHVTKRRLHKALQMDVLVHDEGYYRVNPQFAVSYDVMDFVHILMEGRDESLGKKGRMKAWQRAIDMYRGPFLQGHSDHWISSRRYDYQTGYLEALTSMATVRLNEGRKEHALSLFQKAVTEDNTRQDLHREIMRLFASMGRRSEAAGHYQAVSEAIMVDEETEAVYAEIMS
ncbi:MAG: bacterial transcriptional activator domain-containing protein [Chloroflexota bacterium]